eukprot:2664240-Pyramimonas_sp.AAC.1
MLCPHDWAACLVDHGKVGELLGSAGDVRDFWHGQDMKNSPQYKRSPYFRTLAREVARGAGVVEASHPRPLLLHGDGAPMTDFGS